MKSSACRRRSRFMRSVSGTMISGKPRTKRCERCFVEESKVDSRVNAVLTGKTALVTGASSGIGLAAAARIAGMGAETVLVARDRQRGDRALADVRERGGSSHVTLLMCDLGSMSSVRALAGEFRGRHRRLDLLVNNAGSVSPARRESADGVEMTFAANYLGHFL